MSKEKKYTRIREEGLAQKRAITSVQNVANVFNTSRFDNVDNDELAAISELLLAQQTPLTVAEIAEALNWESDRAASALALGGEIGLLRFFKDGDSTRVELSKA